MLKPVQMIAFVSQLASASARRFQLIPIGPPVRDFQPSTGEYKLGYNSISVTGLPGRRKTDGKSQ